MFRFSRAYQQTAEFLDRQGELFSEILQSAVSQARADLAANLTRLKKQWRKWFPIKPPYFHQLVLELDAIAQIPLFGQSL